MRVSCSAASSGVARSLKRLTEMYYYRESSSPGMGEVGNLGCKDKAATRPCVGQRRRSKAFPEGPGEALPGEERRVGAEVKAKHSKSEEKGSMIF